MSFPIEPPVKPMLAKLRRELPTGQEWLYEPKWDGFRAIIFRDGAKTHIGSRNALPLERYFPELVDVLEKQLPRRCVVDGEIVIAGKKGLEFDSLQMRLHPADSRVRMLAEQIPSTFIAFDLLALGVDHRDKGQAVRFQKLRKAVKATADCFVTPQTTDPEVAADWFNRFEGAGLDGIIAKKADGRYVEGERVMLKIKHQRTADCVVGGYRLSKTKDGIGSLLLGLFVDGSLHFVGHTASFKAKERREILELLKPLERPDSFEGRSPGGPSRWTAQKDTAFVALDPKLVCEVAFDHLQGDRFRHGTTFIRWRADKDPDECTFDQFTAPRPFALEDIRALS